ncbi:MAG: hypothetical protein WB952_00175 [Terriglobales bacterium]
MSIKRAITVTEHMLRVLKRMKDDPQGDTGGSYATPEAALHARWQAVVGDFQSLVDALNEELELERKGLKLIFDTEEFADVEVEGMVQ